MKTTFILLVMLFGIAIKAQDGTLDTSFGTNGKIDYSNTYNLMYDLQRDHNNNKIVAIGKLSTQTIISRFNLDGTLDISFDGDGRLAINFGDANDAPADFLILGNGYLVASTKRGVVGKFNFDGTVDTTFGNNGIYQYNATYANYSLTNHHVKLIETSDNKIFIVSNDYAVSTTNPIKVHKISANGIFDPTFNSNAVLNLSLNISDGKLNGIGIDNSNTIFISGYSNASGYPNYVKKITPTGSVDASYNYISSGVYDYFPKFILDAVENASYCYSAGKIFGQNDTKFFIDKRGSTGGTSATAFGNSGAATVNFANTNYDVIHDVVRQEINNGGGFKMILVGRTQASSSSSELGYLSLTRISSAGTLDTTFGTDGYTSVPVNFTGSSNYTLATPSIIDDINGKIYVMGTTGTGIVSLLRFHLASSITLSTQETKRSTLEIYPNPAKSTLYFSEELSEIKVVDMSGKVVSSTREKTKTVNVEILPKGNYLINAKDKNGQPVSKKFIKD